MEKYTDQTFFYKQTPVNYDGIAKFTSIKGNTLGWNQLVQNGNFESTSNWSRTRVSTSASSNVLTVTVTEASTGKGQRVYQNLGFNDTHKRLYRVEMKGTSGKNLCFGNHTSDAAGYTTISSATADGSWQTLSGFSNENKPFLLIGMNGNTSVGDSYQIRNVVCFDLTQMFGSGNEPSTVEEFTSLFPLPYYDYNQGTLIPFSGNGIKAVGFNQWDEEWEVGSINSSGNNYSSASAIRPKNYIPIIPNTAYCVNGNGSIMKVRFYDGNKNFISAPSWNASNPFNVFTSPTNAYYIRFATADGYGATYKNDICINISSSRNGEYEPYTETTTSLPISTYFPTGMKRAGNVYDELLPTKAITRVGMVDLGSLNWTYDSSVPRFTSSDIVSAVAIPSSNSNIANIKCAVYDSISLNGLAQSNKCIAVSTGGVISAKDTAYTTAEAFKSAMSGVYLYYELATETETDAEDIFYKFYADGTEQLLPVNGSSPETSPIIADIEYYDSTEGDSLYRRFWLINGDGERWDLTDKEFKSFLNNPTGLGFRKTIEITRYGEKANKNNEVYDFPQPSGELLFYDTYNSTRYDKYNKFIRFLMSQPITLYYMIPVSYISGIANIFTLDCDVTEVQKTESKTDHILTSSIVFNGLGFYEGDEISVNGTTDTYTLTNEGDFPVGFEITVEGSLTKPYITLSQDGELYGEAKFDSETAFNSLYLNSNDGEQNIILQQGGSVIPNPLSYQDLSISNGSIYVTFVKLAKGVSELSIGVESGSISNVNIKYSPKYRSV